MKTLSAHVTGFYHSSFHAYTTEVSVDSHRWRLGLRYSKFYDFYGRLVAIASDFDAEFPPKGTLFFTPKPEVRQEQLELFLQHVLAYYAAKGYPIELEALLCDLFKVPRHLKSLAREDDDVSTSTESGLDEPIYEPRSRSDSTGCNDEAIAEAKPEAPRTGRVEDKAVPVIASKDDERVVGAPDSVQLARPVAKTELPGVADSKQVVGAPDSVQPAIPVAKTVLASVADSKRLIGAPNLVQLASPVAKTELPCVADSKQVVGAPDSVQPASPVAKTVLASVVDSKQVVGAPDLVQPASPVAKTELASVVDSKQVVGAPDLVQPASPVAKTELASVVDSKQVVEAPDLVQSASPVAKTELPCVADSKQVVGAPDSVQSARPATNQEVVAISQAQTDVEVPTLTEQAENGTEMAVHVALSVKDKEEMAKNHDVIFDELTVPNDEAAAAHEDETEPIAAQLVAEEPTIETVVNVVGSNDLEKHDEAAPEPTHPAEATVASLDEQRPRDQAEHKQRAYSCWISTYLSKPMLDCIRCRCMKTTSLVALCIALLLPFVLSRR